jgi:hypothetical protein
MLTWLFRILTSVLVIVLWLFWLLFFSERPALETDPAVLAGDGSTVDYCDLPVLDGSGKMAIDIPKGNTPGCGWNHFPLPILAQCTEPLAEGAVDIRGLWIGVSGKVGYVESVEQCGARTVVVSSGIIHDLGPNSTGGTTSNDTEGSVIFTIGNKEYCNRTSAGVVWNEGVLNFHALGWGPVVVKRYREGEQLVWEYLDGTTTRMDRLCTLPEDKTIPRERGPRYKLF